MDLPKGDKTLLLVLLIIQSILIFFRTLTYIIFDRHLLNLDEIYIGKNTERYIEWVLTMFAMVRLLIASIVLTKRGFKNDILSYAVCYLLFSSFLRFYYQYLLEFDDKSNAKIYIDRFQDTNAIILLFISAYIIKFIFF
jgi:hypothetical protein